MMKTEIKKLENSKVEINVEIDLLAFEEVVDKTIKKIKKDLIVQGFRKGKVPENLVIQNVGEMSILNEAAEEVINDTYEKIIKDNKIEPLGSPEIDIIKIARKNPLVFKITISIFPEIKLSDYKKDLPKIEKKEVVVEEIEVDQTLDYIRKSRAKLIEKDISALAEKGDFVEIKYREESQKSKVKSQNHNLKLKSDKSNNNKRENEEERKIDRLILGQGGPVSDFEKEIIGMKKGEKKIFKIKISEKEEKTFNLELRDIKKVELPELNDDFIKTIGNFKNLEELKINVREGIKKEKEVAEKQRVCYQFLEKIREKSEIDVPDLLIESEQKKMFDNFKQNIEKEMAFEDYLEKTKKIEKEILESYKDQAKIRVINFLILREIAKNEKIEVSQKEIETKQKQIIQYYGLKKEDINKDQIKKYAEEQIINEKTFDYIYLLCK